MPRSRTTGEIERIPPLAHQPIHLYGLYRFDLATGPDGHRPLRVPPPAPAPAPKRLNRVSRKPDTIAPLLMEGHTVV